METESEDFLAWLGVSATGRMILQRAAQEFEKDGTWITLDDLAYEFADSDSPSTDLNEVFRLPNSLGSMWNDEHGEQLALTGLGLIEAETAPRSVEKMAILAKICADRKRQYREKAKVGRVILETEYGFAHEDAKRSLVLIQKIPGLTSNGVMGDDWSFEIWRGALDYLHVDNADDLRAHFEKVAKERLRAHNQARVPAPAFAPGGIFNSELVKVTTESEQSTQPTDDTAVFVIHGRDNEAKEAIWSFLADLGLHALDWEGLVSETGSGTPYIGQILDVAFQLAKAVLVLLTPDDCVKLHPALVEIGEESYELQLSGQPRPNVLFEAGMAFGFNPSRTIIVEIGVTRPISDLRGRHTVRIGTQDTLKALAGRLKSAGCNVEPESDAWLNVERFANLQAKGRRPSSNDGQ